MNSDYFGKVGTHIGTDRPDPLVLWDTNAQYPRARKGTVPSVLLAVQCSLCRAFIDHAVKGDYVDEDDIMVGHAYKLAMKILHKDGCTVPLVLAADHAGLR